MAQSTQKASKSAQKLHAKKKILSAASSIFAKEGVAGLSVRSIAQTAGVSTIGIYSHFNGKQGILDALYIEGYELVYNTMAFQQDNLTKKQILLKGIEGYLALAKRHEGHYRLIFGENDKHYQASDDAKQAATRAFKRLVKHTSIILPNDASRDLKQKIALELWAFVHGYVSLKHHATSALISTEQWYKLALDAIGTHIDALILKYSCNET